jgi:type I restriction-modification system DNA methylase subunit
MSQHSNSIAELTQGFAKHIKALKSPETKEATIRQNYIDPFWRALGWDVGDTQQRGPTESEVIIEKNVETVDAGGLRSRRPDYLFRLGGFPRFIVEAKKPAVDIDEDKDAIFQAKQYAWNSTIPFAILTDFEQFRLYDTTLMPIFQDPNRGLVKEFSLDFGNYISQWDVLASTFGRSAVADGSLERLLAKVKRIKAGQRIRTVDRMLIDLKGSEPVDQAFLSYLDTHRRHIAAEIYRHNKAAFPEADTLHGAAKLTEAVQRIMDRLVFMRVCEDRGIIPFGSLRETLDRVGAEGGEFYDSLTATFREMDAKYNGYLYKPHFSEELKVDGSVLADFTRTLYPPDGAWDFAAIGDDILGIVYERFLGNVVTVKKGQATIEEKPEVRHAGGVYYTPRFIVDTIIRRVIGPKIQDKTPAEVLDVKILDPACGSGSFLVAALQFLFDYCLAAIHADPSVAKALVPALSMGSGSKGRKKKSEIAFQDKVGRWFLAPDFRAALLTNCIHGVDIDQQAVEVTVMSLYLKMLESKLPENWATLWVERQLLPPLDNNIQCGNSLIDEESYFRFREKMDRNQGLLYGSENEDTTFRINRFDWTSLTRGFGRLLDSEAAKRRGRVGFDCIIGNPPYIRVQELNKWAPEECEFYKWRYESAAKGNYDIYVVFIEKCLSLLAPDGLLAFIMPHKFWQAAYGVGIRGILSEGRHVRSIVDFGHQQVFRGATTYTAVQVFGRERIGGKIAYAYFDNLQDGTAQCVELDLNGRTAGVTTFQADAPAGNGPWRFIEPKQARPLAKAEENASHKLQEIADRLYQGVRTSKNEVFVLSRVAGDEDVYYSEALGKAVELEPALLRPFLGGDHIRRYDILPAAAVAVFPYEVQAANRGVRLLSLAEIREAAPKTFEYLKECERVLRAREAGAMDHDSWHAYGRTQNLDLFGIPRILVPDMMDVASFAMDKKAEAAFVSGYGITLKTEFLEFLPLLTGLLNSKLLAAYLKSVSTPLRGGWFRTFPQFLRLIPIKLPTTAENKKLADRITGGVRTIIDAKTKLRATKLSDREKSQIESEIEANERRIDETVFRLYGVEEVPE